MNLELDHVVIFVPDLNKASRAFEALGFFVEAGGDHGSTENALIAFENGAYIELIAVKSKLTHAGFKAMNRLGLARRQLHVKDNVMGRILGWFAGGFGPVDWCARGVTAQMSAELSLTPPREFTRQKPDGSLIRWTLASPKTAGLPMFIDDITPMRERLPEWRAGIHPNGALAITQLTLSEKIYRNEEHAITLSNTLLAVALVVDKNMPKHAAFGVQISYDGRNETPPKGDQACGMPIEWAAI